MAERKTLLVRMRPDIYEALRHWASDEFRSLNGQVEYLLHRALREAGRAGRIDADGPPPPDAGKKRPPRAGDAD